MTTESKTSVTEGLATIHITNESSTDVFYNPVQQFNRDVSIAVISQFIEDNKKDEKYHFKEGITILEALSATGLRSIRYAKEIKECKRIIANDFSKRAVESIQYNIEANNVNVNDGAQCKFFPNFTPTLFFVKKPGNSYDFTFKFRALFDQVNS